MKKIIVLIFGLVLIGGGCFGANKVVEGDWWLAFDLPDDWVMTRDYNLATDDTPDAFFQSVNRERFDVILQSSSEPIQKEGEGYSTENFSRIHVIQMDERRVIPSESEDLGNGFFRNDICAEVEDDACADFGTYEYYLEINGSKYQFKVIHVGTAAEQTEDIILSAQSVTVAE